MLEEEVGAKLFDIDMLYPSGQQQAWTLPPRLTPSRAYQHRGLIGTSLTIPLASTSHVH